MFYAIPPITRALIVINIAMFLLDKGAIDADQLHVALEAQQILSGRGIAARVVSMPSWELFARQDAAYRAGVLPPAVRARVAVEAGATLSWGGLVGLDAVDVLPQGEIAYSTTQDVWSETLGALAQGDLLSNRGRVVQRNADLIRAFTGGADVVFAHRLISLSMARLRHSMPVFSDASFFSMLMTSMPAVAMVSAIPCPMNV